MNLSHVPFASSLQNYTVCSVRDSSSLPFPVADSVPTVGCSHVFCITVSVSNINVCLQCDTAQCIKEWRDSSKKYSHEGISEVTKQCPMCRAPSKYITPSSIFYKHGDARKDSVVNAYKESMARVPCKSVLYDVATKANVI